MSVARAPHWRNVYPPECTPLFERAPCPPQYISTNRHFSRQRAAEAAGLGGVAPLYRIKVIPKVQP